MRGDVSHHVVGIASHPRRPRSKLRLQTQGIVYDDLAAKHDERRPGTKLPELYRIGIGLNRRRAGIDLPQDTFRPSGLAGILRAGVRFEDAPIGKFGKPQIDFDVVCGEPTSDGRQWPGQGFANGMGQLPADPFRRPHVVARPRPGGLVAATALPEHRDRAGTVFFHVKLGKAGIVATPSIEVGELRRVAGVAEDNRRGPPSRVRYLQDRQRVINLLHGQMPTMLLNRANYEANADRIARTYDTVCWWNGIIGYEEMTDHCWLTDDGKVQQVTYASGANVVVNFGEDDCTMPDGKLVPAGGFLASP